MTMAEGDLAVTEIKFVRMATFEAKAPPAAMTGAVGWLRANLLSTPFNICLTIIIALLLAWAIPEIIKFLFIDAVWTGSDRTACSAVEQHLQICNCLPYVYEWLPNLFDSSYQISQHSHEHVIFL